MGWGSSRLRVTLLAAVLCGVLMACSSAPSGPNAAGDGATVDYASVRDGLVEVQYPATWKALSDTETPFDRAYGADGMEIRIAGKFSEDITSRSALGRLDLPATTGALQDYRPVKTEDLTVEGAYDALESRFTFTVDGKPMEGVWIIVSQWPYPKTAAVTLSGPKLDEDFVQHITDTLVFHPDKS